MGELPDIDFLYFMKHAIFVDFSELKYNYLICMFNSEILFLIIVLII